jgi:hypothetical protein
MLLSSLSATIVTVSVLFDFFFCLRPCPSLPPPFDHQSGFLCPSFLQFLQTSSASDLCDFLGFFPFPAPFFPDLFPCAASAVSAFLVRLSLITQCCASSMSKAIRSSGFICCNCPSMSLLACLDAVMVWRVGR